MSGPKVVRIVTRDELISICEGHIARVQAALEDWVKVGKRNDAVTDQEISKARQQLDGLRRLLAADRFMDLQKQAPEVVRFLRDDQRVRASEAALKAAKARSAARRRADGATALLAALEKAGKPVDDELRKALLRAGKGLDEPAAMSQAFGLLSTTTDNFAAERKALAERHKDAKLTQTFADWMAKQPAAHEDLHLERLERRLSEMAALIGPEVRAFDELLERARHETDQRRRALLMDSLELDLGRVISERRTLQAAEDEVRLALAELAALDPAQAARLVRELEAASTLAELASLATRAQAAIEDHRQTAAAEARRAAVLTSLAAIGYEVTEGMSTSWVQDGRVVLRKPAQPGYGIEVSGNSQTARLQLRAVAFTDGVDGPDAARDRDAETIWCGDVSALESSLAQSGGGLQIERAMAVGETPLKRVVDPVLAEQRREAGRGLQSRTLR